MNINPCLDMVGPAAAIRRATGRRALLEHQLRRRQNAALFLSLAHEAGIATEERADSPVIPCIVGSSIKALRLSGALMRRGINAYPILFAPEDKAGLQFFVASCYSEDQIRFMVNALAEELELLNTRN